MVIQTNQIFNYTKKNLKINHLNSINEMVSGLQKAAQNNMTRLPTRDIPPDPDRITRDPQVQPNYVPPPPQTILH